MSSPFANRDYRRLFAAQVTSLVGTGVTTVALALLVLDLTGGSEAARVLGIALALKMVVYVAGAPLMSALSLYVARRTWLMVLDLLRAGVVLCLPFVTEVWQVYVLVVAINLCAASFTPVMQASIPSILGDESQYRRALAYTQTAYALEQIVSPALAAGLLAIVSYNTLFGVNAVTFVISAILIAATRFPAVEPAVGSRLAGVSFGVRAYLKTPRLRATWAMYFAVAAASAMVIVNSVIYVVEGLGKPESALGITLAASGGGAMLGALVNPRLLDRFGHRPVMLSGSLLLSAALLIGMVEPSWPGLLVLWFFLGFGLGTVQTPVGSLVRMSCHDRDSAALFAANFSLTHFCWFFGYLLAGFLGELGNWPLTFGVLGALAAIATVAGWVIYPSPDPLVIEHTHETLEHSHEHDHDALHASFSEQGDRHRHEQVTHRHYYVIDEHHRRWA